MSSQVGFSWGYNSTASAASSEITNTQNGTALQGSNVVNQQELEQEQNMTKNRNDDNKKQLAHSRQPSVRSKTSMSTVGSARCKNKRRHDASNNDENINYYSNINTNKSTMSSSSNKKKNINTMSTFPLNIIQSQSLPLTRSLELMNKEQLTSLIMDLVMVEPQLQTYVQNNIETTYNFDMDQCLHELTIKFQKIIENIPYNKKYDNTIYNNIKENKEEIFELKNPIRIVDLDDYSFIRIKPFILEFLNCLIDYLLFNIPPNIKNLFESLKFLDSATIMLLNLPRFELPSNNYYYDKCFEQISFIWCTLINHLVNDPLLLNLNDNNNTILINWFNKLQEYNTLANGLLQRPLQLINSLIFNNSMNNQSSSMYDQPISSSNYTTTNNINNNNTHNNILFNSNYSFTNNNNNDDTNSNHIDTSNNNNNTNISINANSMNDFNTLNNNANIQS